MNPSSEPAPSSRLPLPARVAVSLEEDARLDPAVDRLAGLTTLFRDGAVGDVLRGSWLGHAVHPALTDLPLGLWTAASVLDLVGGPMARPAAQRLVGLGLMAVPPTAASGWAEWHETDRPAQRVGVAHVALNVAGIGLYAGSWLARHRDRHRAGVILALLGAGFGGAASYLGGHLASVDKVSSVHPDVRARGGGVAGAAVPSRRRSTHPTPSAQAAATVGVSEPTDNDVVAAVTAQHTRIAALAERVGHAPAEQQRQALNDLLTLLAAHEAVEEELIHPIVPTIGDREIGVARAQEESGMAQQISLLERLDVNESSFAVQFQLFEAALSYHSRAEEEEELPKVVQRLDEAQSALVIAALADLESWATTSSGSFAQLLADARARVRSLAPA
ncbi:MAG: hypothetical protein JWP82_2859 [Humibacillus sp.]|nr:hypothetical protein [Humibacillus sp.]